MKIKSIFTLGLVFMGLAWFTRHAQAVGASTPFRTLEAESGIRGGAAVLHQLSTGSAVPTVSSPELEASGAAYVALVQNGDSVSWTNPVSNANGLNIRCSIPDAPNGGGITATLNLYVNGVLQQPVIVSSKQSWNYRLATPNADNPNGGGMAYKFYNEDRVLLGTAIPAGATIKLQKDSGNGAAYYNLDCIDVENVPSAKSQPANSLSVISYGADPNFSADSTAAIQSCVNDARSQGKTVWIPSGKYKVASLASTPLNFSGVTVEGAGVWRTMLYRQVPLPPPTTPWRSKIDLGANSVVRDISLDSNSIYKGIGDASGADYGFTSSGSNWLIERIWVQHCDPQWLTGTDGTIRDSRIADSWADGINLNNGNVPNPSALGLRLTAQNNFVRGAGDDSIATYSDSGINANNTILMDGTKIVSNTLVAPWWANGLRVAGGKNVLVQNNLISDSAAHEGMVVSTFGTTGHPLLSATVVGNVIRRGGGWSTNYRMGVNISNTSNVTFTRNIIEDSRRNGIQINGSNTNLVVSSNVINHAAWTEVQIGSGATGSGTLQNNAAINVMSGQVAFADLTSGTFSGTFTGNSWQTAASVANGTYKILARHSGLALDTSGGGAAAGTGLVQWGYSAGISQKWVLTQLGGNAYKIIGVGSGRAVDVTGNSTSDGTQLDLWDWLSQANQIWLITATDSGYYTIVSVNSGKAMEVNGGVGATSPGAMVDQWTTSTAYNKQWLFGAP